MKPMVRVIVAGFAATLLMLGVFAGRPAVLEQLEWKLLDWRFQLRGEESPETPVVIVAIDAKSVEALGRWPWPRSVIAELIDRLSEGGVAAIGLDINFAEPELNPAGELLGQARRALAERPQQHRAVLDNLDHALKRADRDALLEESLQRSGRVVMGYFFRTAVDEAEPTDAGRKILAPARIRVKRLPREGLTPILECAAVETNLARFHASAYGAGFLNAHFDLDGVVRHAPLVMRCGDDLYPSLPLALVEAAVGKRSMVVGDPLGVQDVILAGSAFPTDEGGRILVNYRGPAKTFLHLPAIDVLRGEIPGEVLAGRIALVGATEIGIGDIRNTPFGRVFPGVEIHANVIDNLLSGEVLRKDSDLELIEIGLILGLGLIMSLGVPLLGSASRGALLAVTVFGLLVAGTVLAFNRDGLWINLAYPGLTVLLVYIVVAVAQSVTVERSRRQIRRAFTTYVPPEVVSEMIQSPESFKLGGELRNISILFSDIRSFTSLSQDIGPENTALLMNTYLTEMTTLIFESRGTLDKYIGDSVVAFWGAPLDVEAHPQRVAEVAVAMQQNVAELRRERTDVPGIDRLQVGIGIHTAEVVVGNLGSELRFDYTMVGDGVNLCSRLEGLTKYYGVGIIASAEVALTLPADISVRKLDTVQVVGKNEPTQIFEIRRPRAGLRDDTAVLEAYAAALEAFHRGDWRRAEELATQAQTAMTSEEPDGPTAFLLERVRDRAAPDDWQGVWNFESK